MQQIITRFAERLLVSLDSSANQVKPVRILDAPIKQKFFFGLLEPGQEVPDLYFLKKK